MSRKLLATLASSAGCAFVLVLLYGILFSIGRGFFAADEEGTDLLFLVALVMLPAPFLAAVALPLAAVPARGAAQSRLLRYVAWAVGLVVLGSLMAAWPVQLAVFGSQPLPSALQSVSVCWLAILVGSLPLVLPWSYVWHRIAFGRPGLPAPAR